MTVLCLFAVSDGHLQLITGFLTFSCPYFHSDPYCHWLHAVLVQHTVSCLVQLEAGSAYSGIEPDTCRFWPI